MILSGFHSFIFRFINDQPLESGLNFHMVKKKGFTGDYTHSLSIDNTEIENAGKVKAVAINKAGETTSTATLTVEGNVAPKFLRCHGQ